MTGVTQAPASMVHLALYEMSPAIEMASSSSIASGLPSLVKVPLQVYFGWLVSTKSASPSSVRFVVRVIGTSQASAAALAVASSMSSESDMPNPSSDDRKSRAHSAGLLEYATVSVRPSNTFFPLRSIVIFGGPPANLWSSKSSVATMYVSPRSRSFVVHCDGTTDIRYASAACVGEPRCFWMRIIAPSPSSVTTTNAGSVTVIVAPATVYPTSTDSE